MKQTRALGVRNLREMNCAMLRACTDIMGEQECGPSCVLCDAPFPGAKVSPRHRKPALDVWAISEECLCQRKSISRRMVSGNGW